MINTTFNNNSDAHKVIYIMGRGHSGSTVLDALLGNAHNVESVGELVSGILREPGERNHGKCSCGEYLKDCSYWQNVKTLFTREELDWQKDVGTIVNQAHLKRLFATLFSKKEESWVKDLIEANKSLNQAILETSDKTVLVDSSKEITRALFLLRFFPETHLIHLIRNPENVLASNFHTLDIGVGITFLRKKYKSRRLTPFFIALSAVTWLVGNILAELVSLFSPKRSMRLRYEDLTQDTTETLQALANFLDIDLHTIISAVETGQALKVGHDIGGNNKFRLNGEFVFDTSGQRNRFLPIHYRILVRLICWPLMLAYGYNPFAPLR